MKLSPHDRYLVIRALRYYAERLPENASVFPDRFAQAEADAKRMRQLADGLLFKVILGLDELTELVEEWF